MQRVQQAGRDGCRPVAGDGRHQAAEIRMKRESAEPRQANEAAKAGSDLAAAIKKTEWLLTHKAGWVEYISCSEHELPLARRWPGCHSSHSAPRQRRPSERQDLRGSSVAGFHMT
jgi:hypothetical protein